MPRLFYHAFGQGNHIGKKENHNFWTVINLRVASQVDLELILLENPEITGLATTEKIPMQPMFKKKITPNLATDDVHHKSNSFRTYVTTYQI